MKSHSWVPTQQGAVNPNNSKYQSEHGALGCREFEVHPALKHPKGPGFRKVL